jgi:AraC family transcriptional regulator of adaptative response/methylated-DNA-[protein]-cysteine methyltransferase
MNYPASYEIVEKGIRFLTANFRNQPSLEDTAAHLHLSPFHFQRVFTEWAGISPKKFIQFLTMEALKKEVNLTENLIAAADTVGLSAQSRVYDLFVTLEAVTPGEYKSGGRGLRVEYGIHPTPFGDCFIAVTERGICSLSFLHEPAETLLQRLRTQWEQAEIRPNQEATGVIASDIFSKHASGRYKLWVKGTAFQVKVWEALLKIPFGSVMSYQGVARLSGKPLATRAAASAIAGNPVAYLIPCHRVIRSEGIIGSYRWDPARKTAMIGWERGRAMINEK